MEIVRERQAIPVTRFALEYEWKNQPGAGFSFPCDQAGNALPDEHYETWRENLAKCENGTHAVRFAGIHDYSYTYYEPAIGCCDGCGQNVELVNAMTNTCTCGLEYNGGGQLLAPRSQWDDDTWDEEDYYHA